MEGIALESFIVSPLLEGCRDWEPFYFSFFCLPPDFHRDRPEKSFFTFFLDKKSNKKIKAKAKAPLLLPWLTHKLLNFSPGDAL